MFELIENHLTIQYCMLFNYLKFLIAILNRTKKFKLLKTYGLLIYISFSNKYLDPIFIITGINNVMNTIYKNSYYNI